MAYSDNPRLEGEHVILEPLSASHAPDLREAVGDLWRLWYATVPRPEDMTREISVRLARQEAGTWAPWAVIERSSGRAVGMTSYLNVDEENRNLEIGSTWLSSSVQGTPVNPETKLLLLSRAFDDLGAYRVELRTHWYNRQSRRAIEALGAKLDGVLRKHKILPNGTVRDTCVYSLIDDDWPTARVALEHRLGFEK